MISVFTPSSNMPSHDSSKPGEFSWHELYTTDHEAAFAAAFALVTPPKN